MATFEQLHELEERLIETAQTARDLTKSLQAEIDAGDRQIRQANRDHWCTIHINSRQLSRRLRELEELLYQVKGSSGFAGIYRCKECQGLRYSE